MTKDEFKELLKTDEAKEYLKELLKLNLDLDVEACEHIYGYDIDATAKVTLFGKVLIKRTESDCI